MRHGSSQASGAVVIGGGPNGLAAATRLALGGRPTVLVERSASVGGLAAGDEFHPGYVATGLLHDTAALRPFVIESLQLERHGLTLAAGPRAVLVTQPDGPDLLHHHDPRDAAAEIDRHSSRDATRYVEFRRFLDRVGGVLRRFFDRAPPRLPGHGGSRLALLNDGLAFRRLGRDDMTALLRLLPMPAADWLDEWFESDLLRTAVAARALGGTWMGPRSPGTTTLVMREEVTRARSVVGGPRTLVDALWSTARAHGVEIRTGVAVERILTDPVRGERAVVRGVRLENGETIPARIVAASCDPKRTILGLLDPAAITPTLAHRIDKLRTRGTTAKVNLALSGPIRFAGRPDVDLRHALVTGGTLRSLEQTFDSVKYGRCAETPLLDVRVTDAVDPAPEDAVTVSIIAHFVPYHVEGGWNNERKERLGDTVIETLGRCVPGLAASIVAREVLTPADIETRYGVTQGHIHHAEHALDQFVTRPCPECARYATPVNGLYLCGSGSHPGGGLTCAPGLLAAEAILRR